MSFSNRNIEHPSLPAVSELPSSYFTSESVGDEKGEVPAAHTLKRNITAKDTSMISTSNILGSPSSFDKNFSRSTRSQMRSRSTTAAAAAAVIGTVAAATRPMGTTATSSHDFSAFVASSVTTPPRSTISNRWNIVTPISAAKGQKGGSGGRPSSTRKRKTTTSSSEIKNVSDNKRTESFGPVTATTYKSHGKEIDPNASPVDIHTLILGTHPGQESLRRTEYFGHPMNAFWWIAGDCLGFRRGTAISPSSGQPYKFASHLNYGPEHILDSYQDHLQVLTQHGFALWDIVQSCQRPSSSLDCDIRSDRPNGIREFCQQHRHTLKRIVLANGTSAYTFFKKHFQEWIDEESSELKIVLDREELEEISSVPLETTSTNILVIPALAVSPTAARHTYEEKRDFWDKYVYQPGLKDHFAKYPKHQEE